MSHTTQLSLEQQFHLRTFETKVQNLSREQSQEFLVELYRQMMVKETLFKQFMKQQWGFDNPPVL